MTVPDVATIETTITHFDKLGITENDVKEVARNTKYLRILHVAPPVYTFDKDKFNVAQLGMKLEYDTADFPHGKMIDFELLLPYPGAEFAPCDLKVVSSTYGTLFFARRELQKAKAEFEQAKKAGDVAALVETRDSYWSFSFCAPGDIDGGLGIVNVSFDAVSTEAIGITGREFQVPMLNAPSPGHFHEMHNPEHEDKKRKCAETPDATKSGGFVVRTYDGIQCQVFGANVGLPVKQTVPYGRGVSVLKVPAGTTQTMVIQYDSVSTNPHGTVHFVKAEGAAQGAAEDQGDKDDRLVLVQVPASYTVESTVECDDSTPPVLINGKRRVLIVAADCSGSMAGERWSLELQAIAAALHTARAKNLDMLLVERWVACTRRCSKTCRTSLPSTSTSRRS